MAFLTTHRYHRMSSFKPAYISPTFITLGALAASPFTNPIKEKVFSKNCSIQGYFPTKTWHRTIRTNALTSVIISSRICTLGSANNEQLNSPKLARHRCHRLQPNFSNTDVHWRFRPREKLLVATELIISGTQWKLVYRRPLYQFSTIYRWWEKPGFS